MKVKKGPRDRIGSTIKNFKILDYERRSGRKTFYFIHCLLCGNQKWMDYNTIFDPAVKSCGCYHKQVIKKDLTGQVFDRLTAIAPTEKRSNNGSVIWHCECQCGNKKQVEVSGLTSGNVRSCGCLSLEKARKSREDAREKYVVEGTHLKALMAKMPRHNTSGVKGVTFDKHTGKWRAMIEFKGKRISLGRHWEFADAVQARKEAEEKYYKPILEK